MFFSTVFLFAITLSAILVFANPHALHHHDLHRRTFAARVTSNSSNSSDIAVIQQDSSDSDCIETSSAHTAGFAQNPPGTRSSTSPPQLRTTTTPSSTDLANTDVVHNTSHTTTTRSPIAKRSPVSFNVNGPHTGQGTYYQTGLGACGFTNKDTDRVIAVTEDFFDHFPGYNTQNGHPNPNTNPICKKRVSISYQGRTIDAIIADRCEGCKNPLDIDMSIGVISVLNPGYTGNLLKYVFDGRIYGVVWKIY